MLNIVVIFLAVHFLTEPTNALQHQRLFPFFSKSRLSSNSDRVNSNSPSPQRDLRRNEREIANQKSPEQGIWQSGKIFSKPQGNQRDKKDAWWMRAEEETNPRMLPKYKPKWLEAKVVDNSYKLADLKAIAIRRGLKSTGKKDELISRINESSLASSGADLLSDDHFTSVVYSQPKSTRKPSCYPEVYETPEEIVRLKSMATDFP